MKPVEFPGFNATYAKDQPQYQPLPALREKDGRVTTCWKLSWRERFKMFQTGKIWLSQLTFNDPLQPQLPLVDSPVILPLQVNEY